MFKTSLSATRIIPILVLQDNPSHNLKFTESLLILLREYYVLFHFILFYKGYQTKDLNIGVNMTAAAVASSF